MPFSNSALLALTAAASWGGGDFSGGMGVKAAGGSTDGALRVILLAHLVSLAGLLIVLRVTHAPVPHGAPLAWGIGAGVAAGLSITAFYIALSRGAMGAAAAISGLLAAAIPVAVSTVIEGRAGTLRIAGFVLAMAAIWLIAAGPSPENSPEGSKEHGITMALAIFGGIGFGIYFVGLRMANPLGVYEPVALARVASIVTCGLLLVFIRLRSKNSPGLFRLSSAAILWALGVAVLDTGGNLFLTAATRVGRLDVAAVLASLYPASTILLAAWRLHERPTTRQWGGMAIALAAVVMITLY